MEDEQGDPAAQAQMAQLDASIPEIKIRHLLLNEDVDPKVAHL